MGDYRTPPEARPARIRRWLWRVAIALGIYAALGFLALPALIEWQLPRQASETLGRTVTLGKAQFNPFLLRLRLEQLAVKEADGQGDAAAVDAIETQLQWRSIIHWGLIFSRLDIDAPRFVFTRLDAHTSNWSDVLARFKTSSPEPTPKDDGPARFSVNNIRIDAGQIDINDRPAGLTHTVRALKIGIPFISGFPAQVEHYVQPELSALINGSPLELHGRTRPFTKDLATDVDITLAPFDVAPYLAYLPYDPDFRLASGQLALDLQLGFEQPATGAPRLTLSGTATVSDLAITDRDARALVSASRVTAKLAEYDIFAQRMHLADVGVEAPQVNVVRSAAGKLNLMALAPPQAAGPKTEAQAPQAAQGAPFVLSLDRFSVSDGQVSIADAMAPAGPFSTTLSGLGIELTGLDTASATPAHLVLSAHSDAGETLSHDGTIQLAPFQATGEIDLAALPVVRYRPYFGQALQGAAVQGGTLGAHVPYRFDDTGFVIKDATARLDAFALALDNAKAAAISLKRLELGGVDVTAAPLAVSIANVNATGGTVRLNRDRNGGIDLAGIVKPSEASEPATASATAPPAVRIGQTSLEGWTISVADQSVRPVARLEAGRLNARVGAIDLAHPGAISVELSTVLNRTGYLAIKGKSRLDTFDTALRVDLKKLDLRAFRGYIPRAKAIDIRSAQASVAGQLTLSNLTSNAPRIRYRGDAGVGELIARDTINDTDFLRWQDFRLKGLDVDTAPLSLAVDEIDLADFYSRLILDAKGRLNFRELTGAEADAEPPKGEVAKAEVPPPSEALPPIRIGKIAVTGGNVQYSDRFVRPNYDANLTEVSGTLEGLSSSADSVAILSLNGAIDHGAPVEVTGKLNPLRQDRYLDILATVRDFQLPTISPYSGKYIGYGISKGKLSADLNYKVEDRVLTAQNKVLLDQLTFGDKVESKDAVNLPVQLAVALLKNGRGEINLSVPVSGTLDDPKFSVGGLVWRAFFNLIVKAVTSPFALIGSMFGGGEELAYVDFAPGSSRLEPTAVKKLETLAKALTERPALKIEMTGRTDPAADERGLRQHWLDDRMREVIREELIDAGKPPASLESIEIPAERRDALLKDAYDEADIKKPRNLIGFAKTIPAEQMRALMLASAPVTAETVAALGKHRAQAVRDWLVGTGKINAARIFLVAPKGGNADKAQPRVDFSLK
ncbi:DUF748 domain-containing protein [Nitrogeniibacter mangrovi]|uniref:DUF748 domain-containing protein n=1 Tax=Nitrogeniibacter mangrovi TaxID=2016596 RepID=A0A6C1B3C7_9RHOO|nr:DUF748 domain-containing protein [Nitrogeniibacter mangrovi]QID17893.1 DUF748 domain-containing protein [Nitrogeniibacter mangrovi]